MKKTMKQVVAEQELVLYKVLDALGVDKTLEFVMSEFQDDIDYTDNAIEEERDFVRENRNGTYHSAAQDSRKVIKHLQRVKKEQQKLQALVQKVVSQKKKVEKLSHG